MRPPPQAGQAGASPGSVPQSRQSAGIAMAGGAGQSQAAPRTPEELPCRLRTTGVWMKSENT